MIARRELPVSYREWNRAQNAPKGRASWFFQRGKVQRYVPAEICFLVGGAFSLQINTSIREFEYPWAFHATPLAPGMKVMEIGGSLSGFQFALDHAGCEVVNVDPGMEAKGRGWPCNPETIARLNRLGGTSVRLIPATVEKAGLPDDTFDRVFCISVLEHLAEGEVEQVMAQVYRSLKKGGFFIITVDLFLDLEPFTVEVRNEYGKNVDVKKMIGHAPFELVQGDPRELYGFPEFSAAAIQKNLATYYVGTYPGLAQCLVLRKPD